MIKQDLHGLAGTQLCCLLFAACGMQSASSRKAHRLQTSPHQMISLPSGCSSPALSNTAPPASQWIEVPEPLHANMQLPCAATSVAISIKRGAHEDGSLWCTNRQLTSTSVPGLLAESMVNTVRSSYVSLSTCMLMQCNKLHTCTMAVAVQLTPYQHSILRIYCVPMLPSAAKAQTITAMLLPPTARL